MLPRYESNLRNAEKKSPANTIAEEKSRINSSLDSVRRSRNSVGKSFSNMRASIRFDNRDLISVSAMAI